MDKVLHELVTHEGETVKAIHYANLVGVLVEAVKEQDAVIRELRAINSGLDQRLRVLGAR